jgi:hypothetical protein
LLAALSPGGTQSLNLLGVLFQVRHLTGHQFPQSNTALLAVGSRALKIAFAQGSQQLVVFRA